MHYKKGVIMTTENGVSTYTFAELSGMEHDQRVLVRNHLRNCIAEEIAKSNQLNAEILWLQNELSNMRTGK